MKIIPISAFTDNYIWIILDEVNRLTFCVDPGDAAPVIDFLRQENIELNGILLTHHHYDHIGGVSQLQGHYPNLPVYGPPDNRISELTHPVYTDNVLKLSSHLNFKIIETPGHTSTHICFFEPNHGWLFCGDTLFSGGCGRVFDGTYEQLYHSLNKLRALPEDTLVYCAHEYTIKNLQFAQTIEPSNLIAHNHLKHLLMQNQVSLPSTIHLEKQINPFLRLNTDSPDIQAYALSKLCSDPLSIFIQLRKDKDSF